MKITTKLTLINQLKNKKILTNLEIKMTKNWELLIKIIHQKNNKTIARRRNRLEIFLKRII